MNHVVFNANDKQRFGVIAVLKEPASFQEVRLELFPRLDLTMFLKTRGSLPFFEGKSSANRVHSEHA